MTAKRDNHLPQSKLAGLANFSQFLEEKGLAASTIRAYLRDAAAFERWEAAFKPRPRHRKPKTARITSGRRIEPSLDSRDLALGFLASFEKPISPPYRNRLLASLRQLFQYRKAKDALQGDKVQQELFSVEDLKRQPVTPKAAMPLSLTELRDLISLTQQQSRPTEQARNVSLLLFLYGTGLTVAELCALRLEDIQYQEEQPYAVTIAGRKSGLLLPLSAAAQSALRIWLYRRSQLGEQLAGNDYLWITLSCNRSKNIGDPLKPRGVQALLKHYGEEAKLAFTLTPSLLRQTFKHQLEQAGVAPRVIHALLGYRKAGEAPDIAVLQEAVALLPDPVARTST